ncbi:hypothetical protein GCM10010975_09660 [Comamonas phosphati]|nr:hypothetical protein GCM10010975_09660 [Comamonas phosphati]
MSHPPISNNVPGASQGTAEGLAAPGRAGAGGTICDLCGFAHTSPGCPTDDEVVSWYDSQTDEFLIDLQERCGAWTPREAWNAFFLDAVIVRGSNKQQWLSIASFLALQNLCTVLQQKARSAAATALAGASGAVAPQPLPVGNHGEIVAKEQSL